MSDGRDDQPKVSAPAKPESSYRDGDLAPESAAAAGNEVVVDLHGSKHTPGPWADRDGIVTRAGEHGRCIKIISPWREGAWNDDAEARANARLIAAAPDMLAALKVIVGIYDDADDPNKGMKFSDRMNLVRAAITKAEAGR